MCGLLFTGMLLAGGLALPVGAQPLTTGTQPLAMVLWSTPDPGSRFSIGFPLEWQVQSSEDGRPAIAGVGPGAGGQTRPSVNVVVDSLASPLSSEAFAQTALPTMRETFRELTVIQQGPTEIANHPAYFRYCTWRTRSGAAMYQVQVYVTVGRRAFVITGMTRNEPEPLQIDFPVIVRIIGTFHPSAPQ
jgi:hypothetical protein